MISAIDKLETLLEAIREVKRDILKFDPDQETRKPLDEAYAGLAQAERAIGALLLLNESKA